MAYRQRGLDQNQEQISSLLIRDTRTLGQKFFDFFKNPSSVGIVMLSIAMGAFLLPGLTDLFLLLGIAAFILCKAQRFVLPFRMPKRAKCKDFNSMAPGTNNPLPASGIYYFGNDRRNNDELWFTNEDMRTHILMFGSTGSGKTEFLISLAYNALLQSSGFIYVDGKGDNTLFSKIFSIARYMGREDDLLMINFMTGARDIIGPQEKRLSNTMNPFARGSSSMLSQLVVGLMDAASNKADGDMWKGRAIAFVEALMKVLVACRDSGYLLLDANSIRQYFQLERLESLALDKVLIRDGGLEPVSLESLPEIVMEGINNYLANLPGFQKAKKGKQVSQVYEQHGYITMQLTRVFTSLADTYGHILRTNLPEVDLRDVVLNRRLLVVLLPALEKSPDELANLGKIIIASLRTMMAAGLGDEVEGMYHQIVDRKPTNCRTPFLCILDEYGYYAVPGFAVVPAQARALGFSVVFAGQDLPALQKASKEEAATIGANTNIKICMKLEDPMETWEFFMKTAGESYVTHVSGFQSDGGTISAQYNDTKGAQLEKRQRVDLLDLKEQGLGEAHIFFKSKIIRARTFYANPKIAKEMRLNQYVKIDVPTDAFVRTLVKGFDSFKKLIGEEGKVYADIKLPEDEIKAISELLTKDLNTSPIERGIATLLSHHERLVKPLPTEEKEKDYILPFGEIDVFTKLRPTEEFEKLIMTKDIITFGNPILYKSSTRNEIAALERIDGKSEQQANNIAIELVKDMETASHYPPRVKISTDIDQLVLTVNDLIGKIAMRKKEHAENEAKRTE